MSAEAARCYWGERLTNVQTERPEHFTIGYRRNVTRSLGVAKTWRRLRESILKRLGDMLGGDAVGVGQIGDRAADPEHTVASPRTQAEFLNRRVEHVRRARVQPAVFVQFAAFELPVKSLTRVAESHLLALPSLHDSRAYNRRRLAIVRSSDRRARSSRSPAPRRRGRFDREGVLISGSHIVGSADPSSGMRAADRRETRTDRDSSRRRA